MIALTNTEAGARKFWKAEAKGTSLTTWWGRIGSDGQSKTISFPTPDAAKSALDKLVAEKRRKGYADTKGAAASSPAVKPAKPSTERGVGPRVKAALHTLDAWLRANRPRYYKQLRKPATDEQLARLEKQMTGPIPPAFKTFLGWKNGQSLDAFGSLFANYQAMGVSDILEASRDMNELAAGGEFNQENWWRPKWLPFLDDGGGNHLVIDLEGTFTGKAGQVLEFWHDHKDRTIRYGSFEAWLITFADSLDADFWRVPKPDGEEEEEELEVKRGRAYEKFVKAANPGYPIRKKA